MALKFCKECSRKYSDTLEACPHCGYKDNAKVTIYGYTESFALNPNAKIYIGGKKVASVARNSKVEINISEPCELKISCNWRSTSSSE